MKKTRISACFTCFDFLEIKINLFYTESISLKKSISSEVYPKIKCVFVIVSTCMYNSHTIRNKALWDVWLN